MNIKHHHLHSPSSVDAHSDPVRAAVEKLCEVMLQAQQVVTMLASYTPVRRNSTREDARQVRTDSNEALALSVNKAATALGVSRGNAYSMMKSGSLRYAVVGGRRKITLTEIRRLLGDESDAA